MTNFLSIDELSCHDRKLFEQIKISVTSESFPCLFAINSFYKKQLYVFDARKSSFQDIYCTLNNFKYFINGVDAKSFYTLIMVFNNLEVVSADKIKNFVFNTLIEIKKNSVFDKEVTTNDIIKNDFKYTIDGYVWFPVFMCPKHLTSLRKSSVTLLAFQPEQTFNNLKSVEKDFYQKNRQAIHAKIQKVHGGSLPFYMSSHSSGINAIQYLGFDPFN